MRLENFAKGYVRRRDLSPSYRHQLICSCNAFSRTLDRPADVGDLNVENINRLIADASVGKTTRSNRRRMLMTLANDAARQKIIPRVDPFYVDQVRKDKTIPRGYSIEEANAIINTVASPPASLKAWLDGIYPSTGNRRGDWWLAYLGACWCTGAPQDMRLLKVSQLDMNGRIYCQRAKTGRVMRVQLGPGTLEAVFKIRTKSRYVFPKWCKCKSHKCIGQEFRKIADASRVGGYLKYFRSGAGSSVEKHNPGKGHIFLANSERIFKENYEDPRLVGDGKVFSPELLDIDAA